MKHSWIILAAAFMLCSCGVMKSSSGASSSAGQSSAVSTSSTTPSTAGQGAGNALQALYKQFKADGNKFDYTNMQNILNTVTLVANCEGLKQNYNNKSYLSEFGKGLIVGSLGLVTQDNVSTVTDSLIDMVKNTEAAKTVTSTAQSTASTAAGYANTAAQYAGALSTLLSAFGGN